MTKETDDQKIARYREAKIREKAKQIAEEHNISLDQALAIARQLRQTDDETIKNLKICPRKQKTKRNRKRKNNSLFQDRTMISGAPPMQGGSPGGGKKR